jgi:hypothetical protein
MGAAPSRAALSGRAAFFQRIFSPDWQPHEQVLSPFIGGRRIDSRSSVQIGVW